MRPQRTFSAGLDLGYRQGYGHGYNDAYHHGYCDGRDVTDDMVELVASAHFDAEVTHVLIKWSDYVKDAERGPWTVEAEVLFERRRRTRRILEAALNECRSTQ